MQPTKYPDAYQTNRIEALLGGSAGLRGPETDALRSGAPSSGREAPLVLIEEHLTDNLAESQYRQAFHAGHLIKNWSVDKDYVPASDGMAMVLKVQEFKAGGFEATVRSMDLEKIGGAIERGGRRGKREQQAGELSHANIQKSGQRAKRHVRHLVKNMGATNLVTLTKREGPSTKGWTENQWQRWESGGRDAWTKENGAFWTPDQWASAWDKMRRNLERVMGSFPYVATLEQHRKGNYHIHLAWTGKVNLNLMRPIWLLSSGGKGSGNIDSRYFKSRSSGERSAMIAKYISKYVTKGFEEVEGYRFNKKRYWASRQDMPEVRRYILRSRSVGEAIVDLYDWMEFRFNDRHNFFQFPSGEGFWWNFIPEIHGSDPPF